MSAPCAPSVSACSTRMASPGARPICAALRWSSRTVICGISTCFSTVRSTRPGTVASCDRICSARPRSVSVSSPKILTAICARTPDSRWSSRWLMGWPMATCAGSVDSLSRMSAMMASRSRPDRWRSTSISAECTPSACSSSSARPVRRPTCVTSGTWRISVSATEPTLLASASEVPGCITNPSTSEPSLKAGRKARGKNGTVAAAPATASAASAINSRARPKDQCSSWVSWRLSHATSGLSPWSSRFMVGSM